MPIYEFRCQSCGHRFERLQKISEPDPERCPECGAPEVARLISPAAFRLKGGGWYETDFKKSNRRNVIEGQKSSKGEAGGDEKKPAGKAESASAATSSSSGDKAKKGTGGTKSDGEAAA